MNVFHRHRWLTPYLLLAPGLAFLAVFFLIPTYYLGNTSLQAGTSSTATCSPGPGRTTRNAISSYDEQFIRSLEYAAIATVLAFLITYPLAYWIAFRGGRWKNLLLLFIIAPFFVTYLIRTLAWQIILTNDGFVVETLRTLHLLDADGRLLASSLAVVAGITYNFLPFMALPLYVSLEQIDHSLIEAAKDLYANRVEGLPPGHLPALAAGGVRRARS